MSLPTVQKTYQFNINQATSGTNFGGATAFHQEYEDTLLAIKNSMKGFALSPWTVVGSSDSTTAGMDAVDRWTDHTKLVWNNAGVRSWIVLKQTGIVSAGSGFQICIHCNPLSGGGFADTNISIIASASAGFTGGSTSARPTATDEYQFFSGAWLFESNAPQTGSGPYRIHVMQSTDGSVTRALVYRAGALNSFWSFEAPSASNLTSGWTNPYVAFVGGLGGIGNPGLYAALYNTARAGIRVNGFNAAAYWTCESFNGGILGAKLNFAQDIDSSFIMAPIGIATTQSGARGRWGILNDIWWGTNALPEATNFPSDASRQFVQFGNLIIPWNGIQLQTV